MGDKSKIGWTDATWNPVVGCTQVSPGCDHCYAKTLHDRRHAAYQAGKFPDAPAQYHQPFETVQLLPGRLEQPLRWRKPRRIFVNSLSDLFHADVPTEFIDQLFGVMAACPRHTFQILTKRPQRLKRYLNDPQTKYRIWDAGRPLVERTLHREMYDVVPVAGPGKGPDWCYPAVWPLPNVWLGVSVESNAYVYRAEMLRQTPAAVRFVSAEPLLGSLHRLDLDGIDWLIAGGESGGPENRRLVVPCRHWYQTDDGGKVTWPAAACDLPGLGCHGTSWRPKPEALSWVRDLRDRCQAAGVAFLFKQFGGPTSKSGGRLLDGREWNEYPGERDAEG